MNTPEPQEILDHIDKIMHLLKPRWCGNVTMDGRYPCWIVWLPKQGTCEVKSLKQAIIECCHQIESFDDL